mmetsp:Transcript_26627/g.91653  ORF Transcript_26627/g.91653 Transcript_26627/m.91653 type:complete len:273 (-) Transcript_26627:686-1504(-)
MRRRASADDEARFEHGTMVLPRSIRRCRRSGSGAAPRLRPRRRGPRVVAPRARVAARGQRRPRFRMCQLGAFATSHCRCVEPVHLRPRRRHCHHATHDPRRARQAGALAGAACTVFGDCQRAAACLRRLRVRINRRFHSFMGFKAGQVCRQIHGAHEQAGARRYLVFAVHAVPGLRERGQVRLHLRLADGRARRATPGPQRRLLERRVQPALPTARNGIVRRQNPLLHGPILVVGSPGNLHCVTLFPCLKSVFGESRRVPVADLLPLWFRLR